MNLSVFKKILKTAILCISASGFAINPLFSNASTKDYVCFSVVDIGWKDARTSSLKFSSDVPDYNHLSFSISYPVGIQVVQTAYLTGKRVCAKWTYYAAYWEINSIYIER